VNPGWEGQKRTIGGCAERVAKSPASPLRTARRKGLGCYVTLPRTVLGQILPKPGKRRGSLPCFSEPWLERAKTAEPSRAKRYCYIFLKIGQPGRQGRSVSYPARVLSDRFRWWRDAMKLANKPTDVIIKASGANEIHLDGASDEIRNRIIQG
jgi:hypothetical protein